MKKKILTLCAMMAVGSPFPLMAQDESRVTDEQSLRTALQKDELSNINLDADTIRLASQLVIDRPVVIQSAAGRRAVLVPAANFPATGSNAQKNLITIVANKQNDKAKGTSEGIPDVELADITVANSLASGINVQSDMRVQLTGVKLADNANCGLLVHGQVIANGLQTSGNGWGGVNVDANGTPSYTTSFKFNDGSFDEPSKVWSENGATVIAPDSWVSGTLTAESEKGKTHYYPKYILANDALTFRNAVEIGSETIDLAAGEYVLDRQLAINKPVTITGAENSQWPAIVADKEASWGAENAVRNLISIEGSQEGQVLLKNMSVTGSLASGINAQTQMDVTLENISLHDNACAGLLVHSKVQAVALMTSGNVWGGVNIDKGTPEYAPSLTVKDCNFYEPAEIWSDDTSEASANYLVSEGTKEYKNNVFIWNGENGEQRFWFREDNLITTADELRMAVAVGVERVNLASTEYNKGRYELDGQLVVTKPITIRSASLPMAVITPSADWKDGGSNAKNNLISIEGRADNIGEVVLEDLIVEGSKASGVNAQTNNIVTLKNVISRNNANAGLLVHCEVNGYGLKTSGNGWGGVNVDRGNPQHGQPAFFFDENCEFLESTKIWSELVDEIEDAVLPDDESAWSHFVKDNICYWIPSSATEEENIYIVYDKITGGTVKLSYGNMPAAAYASIPASVTSVKIETEADMGYKLQGNSLKVNGTEVAAGGIYTFTSTEAITVTATFEESTMGSAVTEVNNAPAVVANEESMEIPTGSAPVVIGTFADNDVKVISKEVEETEAIQIVAAYNYKNTAEAVAHDAIVAFDVTPMAVTGTDGNQSVIESVVTGENGVSVAFAYPDGYSASNVSEATALHLKDDGTIEKLPAEPKDNYILVSGIKSFSKIVVALTEESSAPVTTYYDLYITQSVGAKLVSRHGKDEVKAGDTFTLSLEKEAGYEDCNPAVYVKRGRSGEWEELKLDEVSGYYQIRNVQSDIYVKVSGDGIWPVSNENIEAQEVKVYAQDGKLVVVTPQPTDVQVVSINGALVATGKVAGLHEFANLAEGVYIVRTGDMTVKVRL